MKSDVDLYLNADKTKVVKEGDPEAAFLLVNAGRDMPDAEVEKMGKGLLKQVEELNKPAEQPEEKSQAPVEDKAVGAPAENKARGK